MNIALIITLAVVALGLGVGLVLVLHDWRLYRSARRALARATGGKLGVGNAVSGTRHERAFSLSLRTREHPPALVTVEVPGAVAQDLLIARRDVFDRFAASSGLVQTICSGDPSLDEQSFINAKDPGFAGALLNDPSARAGLKGLFDAGLDRLEWSVEAQALIAEFPSRGPGLEDGARANDVLERIAVFLPWLPLPAGPSSTAAAAAGVRAHGSVEWVLAALALVATGAPCAIFFDAQYPPIQRGVLLGWASALAALGTLSLGWTSWRFMRRSLTGHRHWLPMLPVLAIGSWVCSYALLVWVNGALDRAAPHVTVEAVGDKSLRPRDGTFDYRLHTATGSLDVSWMVYQKVEIGRSISITTHPGRIGIPWRDGRSDIRIASAEE